MRLAARMGTIGTESAFEVSARARALEAEGRSIIHLQIGEPDFDTPANVREAAKAALDAGVTHYPPFAGLPALREAIAADATARKRLPVEPVAGLRHGRRQGRDALRDPRPGRSGRRGHRPRSRLPDLRIDDPLRRRARRCRSRSGWSNDFRLDVDELASLITPRTRLLVINSPANPTGGVLTRGDLERIAELAIAARPVRSSPTRSTAGSCTTAPSTSRSRRCPGWPSGRSCSTASPRRTR